MKKIYWNSVNRMLQVKGTLKACACKKVIGGGDGYLVFIILCIVALVIGSLFREQLVNLFTGLFPQLRTTTDALF